MLRTAVGLALRAGARIAAPVAVQPVSQLAVSPLVRSRSSRRHSPH